MEEVKPLESLRRKMAYHSDTCDKHPRPVQKMVINGEVVCPRCKNEENTLELEKQLNQEIAVRKESTKYNILFDRSVIEDGTLLQARLRNFYAKEQEEIENKRLVEAYIQRYMDGDQFNLILQGKAGVGKSHLAYAVLYELNELKQYSCLFISINAMLRKIKASFGNKESQYTEEYFNRLLSDVDFLVLDDLGAETGAINTDKSATDFVQRVLYDIATTRQSKSTIITTNLNSQTLYTMYDQKLVSRLLRNPEVIVFRETKDKRFTKKF
jgi:DNA replication protein DnaC